MSDGLVDVQFLLPALAKLPEVGLDKETVDTATTLAILESPLIAVAAAALAQKGVPFDWHSDVPHARHCAALVRAAVEAAAAEVRCARALRCARVRGVG
jgi:hypothetical protein